MFDFWDSFHAERGCIDMTDIVAWGRWKWEAVSFCAKQQEVISVLMAPAVWALVGQ